MVVWTHFNEGRATLIFIHGTSMHGFHLCEERGSHVAVFLSYRREGVTLLRGSLNIF